MLKHPTPLVLLTITLLFSAVADAAPARRGRIHPGSCSRGKPQAIVQASNGAGAPVHPSAVQPMKCVLDGLEKARVPISFVYGYACRDLPTSNHPRGLAIDVNQHSRDVTRPNVNRQAGIQIARNCGVTSGAIWRNPDNGHFEVRSSGRQQQAQRRQQQAPQRRPQRPRYEYHDWVAQHRQYHDMSY